MSDGVIIIKLSSILKSRFWVEVVDRFDDPNVRLFWTPWPVKDVFFKQKDCSQTI